MQGPTEAQIENFIINLNDESSDESDSSEDEDSN